MSSLKPEDRVIVALDTASLETLEIWLKELQGVVTFYKVGFELFTAHGWEAVKRVRQSGRRIFLDLKLHDIPTTVAKTAAVLCENEIDMFNVHALGGLEMMKRTCETVRECSQGKKKPVVLAVTVLTSHAEAELSRDLGIQGKLKDQVLKLAQLARKAGLDGVVCSPQEIALLRKELPPDFLLVTPGIRSQSSDPEDQKRTLSPKEALAAGADYLVIGRPITAFANPRQKAVELIASLGQNLAA
ncbi:MAG TPA: orotidine-5'-phosphate decarboxylase [bacterium]|nr:orotidine-5'-phosphate decarboxylase [bacterium]